jgi:hypothetical protein
LSKAGVMATPAELARAWARPWLTPRARARLSKDLAKARSGSYVHPTNYRAPRSIRRGLGAGQWPKLARRAAAARAAQARILSVDHETGTVVVG